MKSKCNIYLICDYREKFESLISNSKEKYNNHPKYDSIVEIKNIIKNLGYNCKIFGGVPELIHAIDTNMSFPNTLFFNFTDGLSQSYSRVQAPILFELLDVPYSSSGPFASAVINNKYYTKLAVADIDTLIPPGLLVTNSCPCSQHDIDNLGYPVIIKPNTEGSSIGITADSVCFNYKDSKRKIDCLLDSFDEVIVEKYIVGYDVTNLLIGNDDLAINEAILIESHGKFLQTKEVLGLEEKAYKSRKLHMAEDILSDKLVNVIKEKSKNIKSHLMANDILRIDYRVTEQGDIYFLEANSMPRISSTSEAGFICQYKKVPFASFIEKYLCAVVQRLNM